MEPDDVLRRQAEDEEVGSGCAIPHGPSPARLPRRCRWAAGTVRPLRAAAARALAQIRVY